MGDEYWKQAYRPLLPDTRLLPFNDFKAIELITEDTAAVIIEPIQAEAGVILPQAGYLSKIRGRCDDMGVLLIFDEIQTGMGRTGTLFFFEQQGVVPDILLLAKSFGGGLPLGAFISSHQNMTALTHDPVLGHLTTFGGNALCCASGKAAMEVLLKYDLMAEIKGKQEIFNHWLKHKRIKQFRVAGLLMALEFYDERFNKEVIKKCIENGLIVDWFLFAPECMRIAPPLTITQEEINIACKILLRSIETVSNQG
jgi:acetylornithine/succinyldiaminopimelate/putrescine aminotransferase